MADYTPDPHYMLAMANQGLPWWKALAELIDNAFDARADRVEVTIKGRTVTIKDNGRGMADVVGSLRLGGHKPVNGRGLGMYGVGLKDAWLSFGDKIDIATVRGGVQTSLTVDTKQFAGNWEGPDPVSKPASDGIGTEITLHLRAGKQTPGKVVFKKLCQIFSPAIVQGMQIIVVRNSGKPKPLSATPLPEFDGSVQDTFEVDGKTVSINIGILKPGERMEDGPFLFAYRHRIIDAGSLGTKDRSGLAMGGIVNLGDGWTFTKNKDGISENCDELEAAIFSRIEHLLQRADQMSIDVQSNQIRTELESMMNSAVSDAKREARDSQSGNSTGSIAAVGSGRKRSKAKKIHDDKPGSVTDSGDARRRGLKIDWCRMSDEEVGKYDARANTVNLNLDHSFVSNAKDDQNVMALSAVAFAIFSDYVCTHKDGQKTMFEVDSFGSTLSRLIKGVRFND